MVIVLKEVSPIIAESFTSGLSAGLDPDAAVHLESNSDDSQQRTVTRLRSRWLHKLCKVCGHTFRPGDEVRILANNDVVHDRIGLRCGEYADNAASDVGIAKTLDFYRGIAEAWPMPDDVPVVRLDADHWLLAPPRDGLRRPVCRVCGHSFRALDHVVLCPCHPINPQCRVAIHRDLFQQMHCYDEWRKGTTQHCLAFA